MNLLINEVKDFQEIFSKKSLVRDGEISSKNITPSKLACEVYEAFRLQGIPMSGEEESFESTGYKESGNSRHQTIQKFLIDHPEVEWVDPETYVKENKLPFRVKPSYRVQKFLEKYPSISEAEAKEILGEYEVNLVHLSQPLSFKLDGLIKYKGEYFILEIKTVSKKDLAEAPLVKHQWQGKAYSFLLKIPKIAWVYESREDFRIKAVFQLIRPEEQAEVRNRLNNIIININKPELLERNTSKCKYCRYQYHCTELFLAKKENSTVLPF